MKEQRRSTHIARLYIFLAGCEKVPEIVRRLEDIFPLYKQLDASYVDDSGSDGPRGGVLATWELLVDYCNRDESPRKKFARAFGLEPTLLCPLKDALEAWAYFEHKGRKVDLRVLGDWVYDVALFQLSDWLHHPEQKELGYTWRKVRPYYLDPKLKHEAPPKFTYTLAVPHESRWEDELDRKPDPNTEDGVRSFNPYAVKNSDSNINLKDYGYKIRQVINGARDFVGLTGDLDIEDWNPESGETEGEFKTRVRKDFKLRLDNHLEKVKRWYYEPPYEQLAEKAKTLKAADFLRWYDNELGKARVPSKRHGDKDYLWTFQRYALGMSSSEVLADWDNKVKNSGGNDKTVYNYKNVNTQVSEVADLAQLPPLTEKKH